MHNFRSILIPIVLALPSNTFPLSEKRKGNQKGIKASEVEVISSAPSLQLDSTMLVDPSKDFFFINGSSKSPSSFRILYDVSRRSPKWVVEHLRKSPLTKEFESSMVPLQKQRTSSRPKFHAESSIDDDVRISSSIYTNSGYDRGIMHVANMCFLL